VKKVIIASEHAGYSLKEIMAASLVKSGWDVSNMGVFSDTPADYPEIANNLANAVLENQIGKGILICGTGIGMCIAANKIAGIRAALCGDLFSARMARMHNDANILCVGAWLTAPRLALEIAEIFLSEEFEGGRHIPRLTKISLLEHHNSARAVSPEDIYAG
jgi:ribose 5-phosphate isomerase B